jgi:hypothetical protein
MIDWKNLALLRRYLTGGTEENDEETRSLWPVLRPSFEPVTS